LRHFPETPSQYGSFGSELWGNGLNIDKIDVTQPITSASNSRESVLAEEG
jgi:hypothetical protein